MRRFLLSALAFGLIAPVAFVGCAEESKVEDKTKITTPSGTTTITKETEVEKTGDMKSNSGMAPAPGAPGTTTNP